MKNLLRRGYHRSLLAIGVSPHLAFPDLLLACIFQPGVPLRVQELRIRAAALFPHIDFAHLRLSDLLRFPIQLAWVCVVRTGWSPTDVSPWARAASTGKRVVQGMSRWLRTVVTSTPFLLRLTNALRLDAVHRQAAYEACAQNLLPSKPLFRYLTYVAAVLVCILCITTPLSIAAQVLFVIVLWVVAMMVRRIPGQMATLLMILLSVTASTRYLWWRVGYTLRWDEPLDLIWGLALMAAELYTWTILILGYLQTAWPLHRRPFPLPDDRTAWPTVDLFIPTYNEPLKVLTPTIYAALGIDWPAEKLNIYLLDDGHRDEFRRFAEETGIGYISRPDNRHAKAGNLNHALTKTSGEYVAIFDCDHIPTRSFLQATMGCFLKDPQLAMLQTPHHFFSPDPFERNLGLFRRTPNEGELFYGVVQDGNDLWNATFFCGSCAVLKRAPLEQVGGIAVETVTEDAHTALKMQRLGYNTAYINLPQAAGLATESLSAHIGQRIRWARGMAQIFRLDNPFFGKGLTLMQRICYGNAMLHFFNGAPRLIFLTAPLAFLLFHAYVIYTPAIAVVAYVLPHMVHANMTNSRIQGKHRHSFWAEVYETVLAWYIVLPTTVALLSPGRGKFNVTAKGGLVEKEYFDWSISLPYLVVVGLNVLGIFFGIGRLILGPSDEIATTLLNLVWTCYNLMLLGAALSVAGESKQVRNSHRVSMPIRAVLHLPGGRLLHSQVKDCSEGGASLTVDDSIVIRIEAPVMVSLWRGEEEYVFPARVMEQSTGEVVVCWDLSTEEQRATLVQCTLARADAWVTWSHGRQDDMPLHELRNVLLTGIRGYRRAAKNLPPALMATLKKSHGPVHWLASFLPHPPLSPVAVRIKP